MPMENRKFNSKSIIIQKSEMPGNLFALFIFTFDSYSWSKNDFELGCPLGKGKFGRVYCARERSTHYMVAMKIMFKSELTSGRVEKQVLREIEIQSRLK